MEKGIRQKRYQKFTKNGKEWTEWFDWSGEEPEWQLKGRLRNEYRTIYPSGGFLSMGRVAAGQTMEKRPQLLIIFSGEPYLSRKRS